jgi:type IX secretion system PorP/SprF family membrane protein
MTMRIRRAAALVMIIFSGLALKGQDTWYGTVSAMHFMYNPAYTGAAGVPVLHLSCYSFLPGNGFGLQSVYGSFDSFFQSLHGGAGVWLSDDMLGDVMNDFRAGASYAYHLRAGNNLFFNAGLTASLVYRGINRTSVILPDDIDPFIGPAGSSEYIAAGDVTMFDLGTGLTFSSGDWYGGISVMHLTQPSLSNDQESHNRLRRLYTINAGASFTVGKSRTELNPSAAFLAQAGNYTVYLGAEVIYRSLMCGLSLWHIGSGFTSAEPSLGWQAGSTRLLISYSYVLSGGDAAFKGTAIVRAGVSVCFNNVEKSRAVHIIKLPCL